MTRNENGTMVLSVEEILHMGKDKLNEISIPAKYKEQIDSIYEVINLLQCGIDFFNSERAKAQQKRMQPPAPITEMPEPVIEEVNAEDIPEDAEVVDLGELESTEN